MFKIDEMVKKKSGHHAFIIQFFDVDIWQIFFNQHLKKQICPKNFNFFIKNWQNWPKKIMSWNNSKLQVHVTFSNMWFDFASTSITSCNNSTFKLKTSFTRSRTFHLNGYSFWTYTFIICIHSIPNVTHTSQVCAKILCSNHEWINNLFHTNITSKSFQIQYLFFGSK